MKIDRTIEVQKNFVS